MQSGRNLDPELLKIPAFKRRRSLHRRSNQQLVMTALDRKKAGLPPVGLERPAKTRGKKKINVGNVAEQMWGGRVEQYRTRQNANGSEYQQAMFDATPKPEPVEEFVVRRPVRLSRKVSLRQALPQRQKKFDSFEAPILDDDFSAPRKKTPQRVKRNDSFGIITHYYEKICVAVIALKKRLAVGDVIRFETADGSWYEQVVESMQIDRAPVFSAGAGDEVGIKLRGMPRVGGRVQKM